MRRFSAHMDKKLKARWIEALRSGDYTQGTFALCSVDTEDEVSYCCLGVLAEVLHGEDAWYLDQPYSLKMSSVDRIGNGLPIPGSLRRTCISLNDSQRRSFDEIADYIEENDEI